MFTLISRRFKGERYDSRKNIHVADAAKATGASVARIASGFLAGLADSLSSSDKA